jgi:hypothetical protein
MDRYCPNCGEPVNENDTFCGECGTALDGGGGSGWDDEQSSGWDDEQSSGWDETGNSGRNTQSSGWDDTQGTGQRGQRGPRQSGRGMAGGGGLPRKNAVDTFSQALSWLVGIPVLAGAFVVLGVVDSLGQTVTGLFTLVGWILSLILWGVAFKYTEQLAFGGQPEGTVDELTDMASEVTGRLLSLVGISIIYFIAVAVGLVFLIVPGIYLAARLALAFPACVLDGQSATDSLSTSWDVASGNVLKLVGIVLINLLIQFGVSLAGGVLGGVELLQSPVFLLAAAPVLAIVGAAVQMAVARVYLENRPSGPQPQGQSADGSGSAEW